MADGAPAEGLTAGEVAEVARVVVGDEQRGVLGRAVADALRVLLGAQCTKNKQNKRGQCSLCVVAARS